MLDFIRKMQRHNVEPDSFTYTQLFYSMTREERWHELIETFNRAHERRLIAQASFRSVILAHLKLKQFDAAFERLPQIQEYFGTIPSATLCHLLCGLAEQAQFTLIDKVLQLITGRSSAPRDVNIYEALIRGFVVGGALNHALNTLKEVRNLGLHVSAQAFNKVIKGALQQQNLQLALDLYKDMQTDPGINEFSVGLLIHFYWAANDNRQAIELFEDVQTSQPNLISAFIVNYAISALCRMNNTDKALALSNAYRDPRPDSFRFAALIDALGSEGRLTEARALFDELLAAGTMTKTAVPVTSLAYWYAKAGDARQARELLQMIVKNQYDCPQDRIDAVLSVLDDESAGSRK
eukprot:TRINITY_DN12450_c0_g1_i1.p1 TRINITY_DN12450_c0_g1~~TRINITY_DN12450_c0_g1_i1.p1  ORF type:complete len:351 (-),score=44.75 TRINITY_DN12450_c0_g1_i1:9-1061(-)